MAFPKVSSHPAYSGNFIPEIWSGKLVEKFYKTTVFGEIANTDYEGEISAHGDKVNIRTIPDITIRDYQKGQTLTNEQPESSNVELLIDKGKYFSFICDDVDKMQSDLDLMGDWSDDAAQQMKISIDSGILSDIPDDVDSSNTGATAGAISSSLALGTASAGVALTTSNIVSKIVDLGTALDEQNIPESDRFLVIPATVAGLIKQSDLKDASITGDGTSPLRNGRIGMIDRFTVYNSNNVLKNSSNIYGIMAGHKSGLTFASQMTEMDTLKSETTFGNIVRGLNVYGYKVVKPEALATLYATV